VKNTKIEKEVLSFIVIIAIVSAQVAWPVHAAIPTEAHAGDVMWTEPSLVSLSTSTVSVGYKFNVTVWINLTESSAAWELKLVYDKTQLNATNTGYTAGDKSDFFKNITTLPLSPTFGSVNATHDFVLCAESWMMGPTRTPGYGSLEWVEFQVMAVPSAGQTLTSTIALSDVYPEGTQETYAQQPDGTKIVLNAFSSTYTITAPGGPPAAKNTLNVTSTVGGSTNATGVFQYDKDTVVYVLASANSGYIFGNWLLNASNVGSVNPVQIKMNASYDLRAIFTPAFTLNVTSTTGGSTNASGTFQYATGSIVYVLATKNSGYVFSNWLLNGTGVGSVNPVQIKMNASYDLRAIFIPVMFTLNVTSTVGGSTNASGVVTYNENTVVYVLASANSGYIFGNWLLNASNVGSVNPVQIKMNASYDLRAIFTPAFTLNVTSTVGGSTNASGVFQYASGSIVYILATQSSGYTFTNWVLNGTSVGSANPIQITMNASYNLQAVFTPTGPPSTNKYDINGDGHVGVDDVLIAVKAFFSKMGDSRWNPNADVNSDGQVRVDDILAIALHFGK